MSFKSKFKTENIGRFAALAFYVIVGIACFVVLFIANFPPHIGIMGILNLIAAYGLFKKRVWSVGIVVMLFFVAITFSAYMLYYFLGKNLLFDIIIIAYLILACIFTAYAVAKRKMLES